MCFMAIDDEITSFDPNDDSFNDLDNKNDKLSHDESNDLH